jgi:DNA-binding transcriptional LysR family regulator
MPKLTFDLDVLRTLATGIELGSFARAADRLGRSTSAVSAQLKKLEAQVGEPVLRKQGRGMVLTSTGEVLLGYAHRLLALNDEAAQALHAADLSGELRLGVQEDFGEGVLSQALGGFARAHPQVRVEARLLRNSALLDEVLRGRLDLALAWDAGQAMPHRRRVGRFDLCWIGAPDIEWPLSGDPLPLAVLDAPCLMRSAATAALDKAGIPWRVAFTSPSLGGVWAAVLAGLGVTVRTRAGLPSPLSVLGGLPALASVGLSLYRAEAEPSPAVQRLEDLLMAQMRPGA